MCLLACVCTVYMQVLPEARRGYWMELELGGCEYLVVGIGKQVLVLREASFLSCYAILYSWIYCTCNNRDHFKQMLWLFLINVKAIVNTMPKPENTSTTYVFFLAFLPSLSQSSSFTYYQLISLCVHFTVWICCNLSFHLQMESWATANFITINKADINLCVQACECENRGFVCFRPTFRRKARPCWLSV